jgi:hypothetical protein
MLTTLQRAVKIETGRGSDRLALAENVAGWSRLLQK